MTRTAPDAAGLAAVDSLEDTRLHALEVAIAHAARIGRPLYADPHDPERCWPLVIHPVARVEDKDRPGRRPILTILLVTGISVASSAAAGMGVASVK